MAKSSVTVPKAKRKTGHTTPSVRKVDAPLRVVNIYYGFAWKDKVSGSTTGLKTTAVKAFRELHQQLKDRLDSDNMKYVNFRRLRGSAGGYLLEDIAAMIKEADILLFDISTLNPNVMLELGVALGTKFSIKPDLKIFIVRKKSERDIPSRLTPLHCGV